jgi:hypothetical protein
LIHEAAYEPALLFIMLVLSAFCTSFFFFLLIRAPNEVAQGNVLFFSAAQLPVALTVTHDSRGARVRVWQFAQSLRSEYDVKNRDKKQKKRLIKQ